MLERIRIVLVETSLPGNIGAAARAMKTMGLSQLVQVLCCELRVAAQQGVAAKF